MKKYSFCYCLLMSIFILHTADANILITPEVLSTDGIPFELADGWRYHVGDNQEWASPVYDDSSWEVLQGTDFSRFSLPQSGFEGTGWFRLTFDVDSSLFGELVALDMRLSGAAELYLNGDHIYSYGFISDDPTEAQELYSYYLLPKTARLSHDPEQVIAVRFVNSRYERILDDGGSVGIGMHIAEPWHFQRFVFWFANTQWGTHAFIFGVSAAIALLHLLMFLFFPKMKSNLYYFCMVTSLMLIMYGTNPFHLEMSMQSFEVRFFLFKLGLIGSGVFSMVFTFSLFREKLPTLAKYGLVSGIFAVALSPFISPYIIYVYTMLFFPFNGYEIFMAWKRKKPGAVFVIDGLFIMMFFFIYQMIADMGVIPRFIPFLPMYQEYLAGVLVMVMTFSLFQAWRVGKTNRDLQLQIVQVKELSEKTIQQEREVQEEKLRITTLEMENQQKDLELAEAKKRQQLMDQLEEANTELELMNKELIQTQAQLVQSEKMASLGLLTAGVAHEINTPVGAIYSTRDTLKRVQENLQSILAEEMGDHFPEHKKLQVTLQALASANQVIESGGERVSAIVKRMKSFARLDEAELKRSDIHDGLDDTLTMLSHELGTRIKIEKDYGDVPPFQCYPGQLNQVFLNLLMNGLQAIDGEGVLSIKTWREEEKVYVAISDTGKGIPEENLKKIFDPGFTTKGVGVGTGLGLSICYNIVQDHHGEIRVDSEVGKGSTFTVVLPLRE